MDLVGKSNARSLALVDQLVDDIQGKVQFKDMCAQSRRASGPGDKFKSEMQAAHRFFVQTEKERSLVLPLF